MNSVINKKLKVNQVNFTAFDCARELRSVKRIDKIVHNKSVSEDLFDGIGKVFSKYKKCDNARFFMPDVDVFIGSKNADGSFVDIEDIVAKIYEDSSLKETYKIFSRNRHSINEFVGNIINYLDKYL